MEGGGTTLAEIYDNDERENYTKIVLQKRMWIHVGEEQLIRYSRIVLYRTNVDTSGRGTADQV